MKSSRKLGTYVCKRYWDDKPFTLGETFSLDTIYLDTIYTVEQISDSAVTFSVGPAGKWRVTCSIPFMLPCSCPAKHGIR